VARRLIRDARRFLLTARRGSVRHSAGAAACATALCCGLLGLAIAVPSAAGPPAPGGPSGRVKSGTGFFVTLDGFLVTSAHVVSGCGNVSIWAHDGVERHGYLIASDAKHDVALLYAGYDAANNAPILSRDPPHPGEEVFTLGFGVVAEEPLRPILVGGSYVGDDTATSGNRVLLIRAKLRAGNSGGALIGADGSLLGMVIGRDEARRDMGVAIPSGDIEAMLSAHRIPLPSAPPRPGTAQALLSAISALIQCAPPDAG
jgi:S1-C subfamily serine protease